MGQVWRATDMSLGRQVAIKILPDAFAADPERLARFEREAKTLASLNHPNIAQIYGFEAFRSGGSSSSAEALGAKVEDPPMRALIMELVEGEDLSQRISRGALPIDEALPIAKQIAEALEAAHEQGIIHRDLKPANIKVRADGTVKVLDFGLAKALDQGSGIPSTSLRAGGDQGSGGAANSPTITTPAMTQAGMILGTAAYMAPEQARGKVVDKRADIWAFGAVLYEMLTGRRPFDGEDMTEVLGAVVRLEPPWEAIAADVPLPVRTLLQRCLVKDPRRRVADISTALFVLDNTATLAAGSVAAPQTTPLAAAAPRSVVARALPWAIAGTFGIALITALVLSAPWRAAPVPAPRTLLASIGADASLAASQGASAILSADGTTLAFVALQAGQARLFILKLDQ